MRSPTSLKMTGSLVEAEAVGRWMSLSDSCGERASWSNVEHARSELQCIELSFYLFTRMGLSTAEKCAQELLLFLTSWFVSASTVLLILKMYSATFRGGDDSLDSFLGDVCAGDEQAGYRKETNRRRAG
jgi:hypothetical protein